MAAHTVPHEVGSFRVAPIKFNSKSEAGQYLYFKEHSVRDGEEAKPTLFVVNVPPYCNEECLKRLFGDCGPVESVTLKAKPGKNQDEELERIYSKKNQGFQVAYVTMKHSSSLAAVMQRKYKDPFILVPDGEDKIATGYRKWCSEYKSMWPDPKELQKKVDDFMAEFDKRKQQEEEEEKETEGVADEDGWVTVTRKSSKPVVARTERKQKKLQAREKKKREEKELINFYTFQNRESKREHIAELRRKFEEDKEKIAQMRASRKFKPY